jgi:signal transduction histidine kinase
LIGRRAPTEGSTAGAVFRDHVPRNVPSLDLGLASALSVPFGPALAMPLRVGESTAGVLLVLRGPEAAGFDEHQLQVVSAFADQAALALQRAEIQAARRELDMLADRDRIARELHDHVIQRLFGIGLAMQGTHRRTKSPTVAQRMIEHIHQLQEVIQEIRTAIFHLQGSELSGVTRLRTRLHDVVTELTEETPIRTTIRMSGPLDVLPTDLGEHAEAVLREAVSNAVRHAKAVELTVTVSVDDHLVIEVSDDGVGIPETVARSGLNNLRQRAAEAGGSCTAGRLGGGGTRLTWTAPLP